MNIKYQPLSSEQEYKLFSNLTKQNKDTIILHNLKLVMKIAKQFKFDHEELFSEGVVGLIKAVDNFNVELGYKFSTFAYEYIRGSMLTYINKQRDDISLYNEIYEDTVLIDTLESDIDIETDVINQSLTIQRRKIIDQLLLKVKDRDRMIFKSYMSGESYDNMKLTFGIGTDKIKQKIHKVERFLQQNIIVGM